MLKIAPAESEPQYQQVRELVAELSAWDSARTKQLGLDARAVLDFYYSMGDEALPGVYVPPDGCLLLATYSARAAGCCAYHKMTSDIMDMDLRAVK